MRSIPSWYLNMKKLVYARPATDKSRVVLGVGDGDGVKRYSVEKSLFESLLLSRGEEVSETVLCEIIDSNNLYRARKKALSQLSISDSSERALVLKLRRAGYSREVAERVGREMVSYGYIDEVRQLTRLVLREANENLRARAAIVPRLAAKGYSAAAICRVLDSLIESGEISPEENAQRLREKMLPESASEEEVKKLMYKYGYGASTIYD